MGLGDAEGYAGSCWMSQQSTDGSGRRRSQGILTMNFVSVEFFVLLAIVLCLLALTNHRAQNIVLLLASFVFYGWWYWKYLALMIGISTIDYVCGRLLENRKDQTARRTILIVGLSANLLILAYFKYVDFLIQTVNNALNPIGFNPEFPLLHVLLPIAISFHTFQSMSYLIDVYRGLIKPMRNFLDYQLFVSFFPVLVAGPIERAKHLLPQIEQPRRVGREDIEAGIGLVVLGFFKKVVIADNLAPVVDGVFNDGAGGGLAVILATYAFALQIYGDFSGYTDIARGVARLMGFHLVDNFRQPYFATNPSDFWRRWHISLSSWLRDYLYIPLGGNRYGPLRTYCSMAITMLLGGLWHGASWTFVIWGAYHGALLIVYRLFRGRPGASRETSGAVRVLEAVAFFQLTCVGWLIFRAQGWDALSDLVEKIFAADNWLDVSLVNVRLIVLSGLATLAIDVWAALRLQLRAPFWLKGTAWTLTAIAIVVLAPENVSSFLYFQF
jgi:alginate O-acetyltransferase complex protein AlgI